MVYQIRAFICQHIIRESATLPWNGSELEMDRPYCRECENHNHVRSERISAQRDYESSRSRYDARDIDRDEYRESQRRYDRARVAQREDDEYWEDRDDRERRAQGRPTLREEARSFAGLDDPEWLTFKASMSSGRSRETARFNDYGSHRRESQYRDQLSYRRDSRDYDPGRYADSSGRGYYNTSDPHYRSRSPPRRSANRDDDRYADSSRRRYQDTSPSRMRRPGSIGRSRIAVDESERQRQIDTLDDDELVDRIAMLRRQLAEFDD